MDILQLVVISAFYVITPTSADDAKEFKITLLEANQNAQIYLNDYYDISAAVENWKQAVVNGSDPTWTPNLRPQLEYLWWGRNVWFTVSGAMTEPFKDHNGQIVDNKGYRASCMRELWYIIGPTDYTARKLPSPLKRNKGGVMIFPWEK